MATTLMEHLLWMSARKGNQAFYGRTLRSGGRRVKMPGAPLTCTASPGGYTVVPVPGGTDGPEPRAEADREPPRRRQAGRRRGDRDPDRSDPAHRHQRQHVAAPVRGHGPA